MITTVVLVNTSVTQTNLKILQAKQTKHKSAKLNTRLSTFFISK